MFDDPEVLKRLEDHAEYLRDLLRYPKKNDKTWQRNVRNTVRAIADYEEE
jgi:hypothetical protein